MRLPEVVQPVSYFCAEFAIDNDLPTYSGGLGILSADLLSAAGTQHFPITGIGILYNGKQFLQHITGDGKEEQRDSEFDHDTSFLRPTTEKGNPIQISIPSPNGDVRIKSYHIRFSDTTILFLLSSDVEGNPPEWVSDMDALYRGDSESQIRQQILLGVGGMRLLKRLNINPRVYHVNEGRPALLIWELAANIRNEKKIPFGQAWEDAKRKIVYTNHTLVSAGNLTYPKSLIEKWALPFSQELKVNTDALFKDGMSDPETFSTTLFALNISTKHSAVSKVHQKGCARDWPKHKWVSITNGVHMARWQDSDFRKLNLSDKEVWDIHMAKKRELASSVIKRTGFGYDPNRLVVSWARRLADYKQPTAIFEDIQRLKALLSKDDRPVQLLFAGNSHSGDANAKFLIDNIINLFSTELSGHAIFVPNYNISLANHMVSGSDVWLNTPKGNLEACGTSGMKAISNGVINCTVLDGWTYEVDWQGIGWVIDPKNVAGSFYDLLEKKIIPLYYDRSAENLPKAWINKMRKSIEISKEFTSERMLEEYKKLLYS